MRVGIDADPIGRRGAGNETYLRGIIRGLQSVAGPTDDFVLAGSVPSTLSTLADERTTVIAIPRGIVGDLVLGTRLRRAGASCVLANYNHPLASRCPVATIVHDVAFLRVPETFPVALRSRLVWSTRRSCRRSQYIVTISEFSRGELVAVYPWLEPTRVVVAPGAPCEHLRAPPDVASIAGVRRRHRLPSSFVLAVGDLQPRKNVVRLASATASLDIPLILVGKTTGPKPTPALASPDVHCLGHVSHADLVALYQLCTVFAYPSLYEGFGLPILEAMAAGAPVVTSATSAMPETAGGAALLVDPLSVEAIRAALERIIESDSTRQDLIARGRRRAAQFSWTASASKVMETLRELGE